MKNILILIILSVNLKAQPFQIKGIVYLINSNHSVLSGVQIIAEHSNATQSDLNGMYVLNFNNEIINENYKITISTIYKQGYDLIESENSKNLYYNPILDNNNLNIYMCPKGMVNEAKIKLYNISTANYFKRIKKLEGELKNEKQNRDNITRELERLKQNQEKYLNVAHSISEELAKYNFDNVSADLKHGYFLFLSGNFDEAIAKINNDKLNKQLSKIDTVKTSIENQLADIISKKDFLAKLYFAKNKLDSTEYFLDEALNISISRGYIASNFLRDYISYFTFFRKYEKCANAARYELLLSTNLYEKAQKYLEVAKYYSLYISNLYSEELLEFNKVDSFELFKYARTCLKYIDTARNLFQQPNFNRDSSSAYYLGLALYLQSVVVFCNETAFSDHQDDLPFILNDAIIFYQSALTREKKLKYNIYEDMGDAAALWINHTIRRLDKSMYEGSDSTKAKKSIQRFFELSESLYRNYIINCNSLNGENEFDTLRVLEKLHKLRMNYVALLKRLNNDFLITMILIDDLSDQDNFRRDQLIKSLDFYETSLLFLKTYSDQRDWNSFDSALNTINRINDSIPSYFYRNKSILNIKRRIEIAEGLISDTINCSRVDKLILPIRFYTKAFAIVGEDYLLRDLYLECLLSQNTYLLKPAKESKKNLVAVCKLYLQEYKKTIYQKKHSQNLNNIQEIINHLKD